METSTYEILQRRLETHTQDLIQRMEKLNAARKEVFGAVEMQLIATDRILTENNCISRDMVAIGNQFIFGYNVHMGLRSTIQLSDVFSIFRFQKEDHSFHEGNTNLLKDATFEEDFRNLYKYYKDTVFSKFARMGPHLFLIFQVGNQVSDVKTFKWLIEGESLRYLGNRFDHEVKSPEQHAFQWKKTTREMHRKGDHPHISILDRVFVETVGGDLTLKVEDNTDSGQGIYSEPVERADQTLDDADFYFADLGNLIVLKIRPYQEKSYRYIIYNDKIQEAIRVDALERACVMLPDNQGIVFSNGYYLQTGSYKIFDQIQPDLHFERRIASSNGEDYLYVFYDALSGTYVMLPYNLVTQIVDTPIISNGFSIFPDGELCYFRSEAEQSKQHTIQIWETPFGDEISMNGEVKSSFLAKIGNKDLVKGLAACNELVTLIRRGDSFGNLYADLTRKAGAILDRYHWIEHADTFALSESVKNIQNAAQTAIGEFEKVKRTQSHTQESLNQVLEKRKLLFDKIRRYKPKDLKDFVDYLGELRTLRGEIIALRDLKYMDLEQVDLLEKEVVEQTDTLAESCVNFLLQPEALDSFSTQIQDHEQGLSEVLKVTHANELEEAIDQTASELELLMETVSNLPIEDATTTTDLIERISELFALVNGVRAKLVKQRKELAGKESSAEFFAQIKLLDQAIVHHLDRCDTPADCEQHLTKLMVRVEELEGKFADFEDFVEEIANKREEVYQIFENRRISLVETQAKRANGLMKTADRILKGVKNRIDRFENLAEINAYFAADLMIAKVRDILEQLQELKDTVKVADLQSRLKSLKEEAVRQLRDRKELFTEGDNVIRLGNHAFSVNHQPLELTMIPRDDQMFVHLTGTQFFEAVKNEELNATKPFWNQAFESENKEVYRATFLAYRLFHGQSEIPEKEQAEAVRDYIANHLTEGYVKGIHDKDGVKILSRLLQMRRNLGLLHFSPNARACASLYWHAFIGEEEKSLLTRQIKGAKVLLKAFPDASQFDSLIHVLQENVRICHEMTGLFPESLAMEAGDFLFQSLIQSDKFVISQLAGECHDAFFEQLKKNKSLISFRQSLKDLTETPISQYQLIHQWLEAFIEEVQDADWTMVTHEVASLIFREGMHPSLVHKSSIIFEVDGLVGEHPSIDGGKIKMPYHEFVELLWNFSTNVVPGFKRYTQLKTDLTHQIRNEMNLESFQPKVLSSFVRNQLVDKVYLPLIGTNLAKQIGTVGEQTRTDRMGLLLLISPPGYGKTTLMEYVANRLGLIFMKINGPAIGHDVKSLDPADASHASAREELEKLNLALEMGDNIMLYVDDIQHCHPEFLQKFISLCDAQRKIEGVYKGRTKTYDLRGKKVAVVMAGNPYTEQGEKFRVPDMLANRADIYNLGDIIGDSEAFFKRSYIENSLTSHPVLNSLSTRPSSDIQAFIQWAETGNREGLEFEVSYTADEMTDYLAVLKKLVQIREIILKVNQTYIQSAGQETLYRTEPPFLLQGSYRNMNQLAEQVMPVMNEEELRTLILSHYEQEAQTLTTGAEANVLKFKQLAGWATKKDQKRWEDICAKFRENQAANADRMAQLVAEMGRFSNGLEGIRDILMGLNGKD